MSGLLLKLLLIIIALWLLRRFIAAFIAPESPRMRPKRENPIAGTASRMVKDPVCGMYMDPRLAYRLEKKSETYYFCSEACRQKFAKSREQ